MSTTLVVAVAENGVIGAGNAMPWRLPSDLKRFKALTLGKPIVMGRKTFQSIGRPLPGRTNIAISRDPSFAAPGLTVAPSLAAALLAARGDALRRGVDEIAVIGGGAIYAQALDIADRIELTRVHATPDGDATFPPLDPAQWEAGTETRRAAADGDSADTSIVTYCRRR